MVVVVVEDKYIRNGSPYPQEQEADGYKEQFYVCLGGCQNVAVLCYAVCRMVQPLMHVKLITTKGVATTKRCEFP